MKPAARKLLKDGIAVFNEGSFEDAVALFERSLAAGGGKEARFCLEHARKSLQPRPVEASGLATAAELHLRELIVQGDFDSIFAAFDGLLDKDINVGYRLARDFWLSGELGEVPPQAGATAWHDFFRSSEAWRREDSAAALRLLDRASRSSPRFRWMRYYLAEILLRRLDFFSLARTEIEATARACPWLWEAHCLRAEILLALGSRAGVDALSRVRVPESSKAVFLAWRGAQRLWSGSYAQALPDLEAAAALGNPDALCWGGGARVMLGRLDEALKSLDRLLELDAKDPEGLVWRGEARRRSGLRREARADLDRAIELYPDSIWAFVNRALLSLEEGDVAAARADFARLAPPSYADSPDESAAGRPGTSAHVFPETRLGAARLGTLLRSALRAARGCRRADSHLNVAWMRAAGIPVPRRPAPQARLLYWMRWKGLPAPAELVFGPGTLTARQAREACGRLTSGAKAGAISHSVPA
ncbi:MAG: tetratricopeptide repeat protein [Elusimicrobiota bacterium]|nr:tetratricopeptide repeat protein [Elusimicrobiota bacterium]